MLRDHPVSWLPFAFGLTTGGETCPSRWRRASEPVSRCAYRNRRTRLAPSATRAVGATDGARRGVPVVFPASQAGAGLVPVPRPGDDRHPPGPAAVPADDKPAAPPGRGDRLARLGPAPALDPRPPRAAVRRGRVEQVGLGVELADQGQAGPVAVGESGDLVGAVARVADEREAAAGAADHQGAEQAAHQPRRGAVRPPASPVLFLAPVEVHEHGQCPGSSCPREADEHRQDDPAVAILPGLALTTFNIYVSSSFRRRYVE